MKKTLALMLLAGAGMAWGQSRAMVRAAGEGVVSAKPDQMKITVSVVTQADTAQQAADDNAVKSERLIEALKRLLGAAADLKTTSYSVSPVYRYTSGQPPVLTGYQASNSLELTTGELALAGRIIDTAVGAGATNIGGIRFGLKDPQPLRREALKLATQQARLSAEAIASGLTAKLGLVIAVVESSTASAVINDRSVAPAAGGAGASTPVETGMVEVRANVIIEVELI